MKSAGKILIAVFLLASGLAASARAATSLCVHIKASSGDEASLHKLVLDELAHHPTHLVVEKNCQSVLVVEFFELRETFFLTARINQEVPIRQEMEDPKELSSMVSDAIGQVLSHDPVYLADDITHYSVIQRAAHSILKRGNNTWRLELFQGIGRGGDNAAFAPGGAVSINRGADHWQVYTRIYFGGWPGAALGSDRVLQVYTGADVGLTYEFSANSNLSFYASAGLGLQYLRFEGRLDPGNPDSLDTRNDFGPSFHARVGIRFLRIYDFDCDLFVAGYIPMFPADSDTHLGDFYPPSLQAGFGVGF